MPIDVYREVTDRIIEALEAGTVPWRNPILSQASAGWPKNLVSGKEYRGSNVFLLALTAWAEGYASPYWLTFRQAKSRGGSITKGERSTMVVFWKQIQVEDKETGVTKNVPVLRHFRVFNAEQCSGVDIPATLESASPELFKPIESAQQMVMAYDGPEVVHRGTQACYLPKADQVRIPEPEAFVSAEGYYATLFHELSHSTGHSSRLDRGLDTKLAPFGSADYSKEELIAEMSAAFLCGHAGIAPAVLGNSVAYLEGWIKRLRGDHRLIIQAAGKAQQSADYVRGIRPEAAKSKAE